MGEKIQTNDNDDLLQPVGFSGDPSLYGEQQLAHNYEQMSDEVLHEKAQRFISILNDPDTLPHHRSQYARLIDYIAFETNCREAERKHFFGRLGLELTGIEGVA
jgi:hypothetical protein